MGGMARPSASKPCVRFKRNSACFGGPQSVTKGFKAISIDATPRPTIKLDTMKVGNEAKTAHGQKIKMPHV